jgi:hypothetical protein
MIQLKKFIQDILNISQIIDQFYTNIGWHLYFEHKPETKTQNMKTMLQGV